MSNIVFDRVGRTFRRDGRDFPAIDAVSFEVRSKEFVAPAGRCHERSRTGRTPRRVRT